VTIEQTTQQIENNQNLALETQTDYVRKTNFIARCLNEKNIQKLVNQPDKVIKYIIDRYPNMNSRTGFLVAFVSLTKHTNLQVTDEVQQKWYDAMMEAAGAAQEIAKDNAPRVASVMLNGKPIQWKDVLECEAIAQGRICRQRSFARCHVHIDSTTKTQRLLSNGSVQESDRVQQLCRAKQDVCEYTQ
jgi:hypothetical protein